MTKNNGNIYIIPSPMRTIFDLQKKEEEEEGAGKIPLRL